MARSLRHDARLSWALAHDLQRSVGERLSELPAIPTSQRVSGSRGVTELAFAVGLWLFLVVVLEAHTMRHDDDD